MLQQRFDHLLHRLLVQKFRILNGIRQQDRVLDRPTLDPNPPVCPHGHLVRDMLAQQVDDGAVWIQQ
jgi:hypothetical protein